MITMYFLLYIAVGLYCLEQVKTSPGLIDNVMRLYNAVTEYPTNKPEEENEEDDRLSISGILAILFLWPLGFLVIVYADKVIEFMQKKGRK